MSIIRYYYRITIRLIIAINNKKFMDNSNYTHELIIETDVEDIELVLLQASLSLNDFLCFYQKNTRDNQTTKVILTDNTKQANLKFSYHFVVFINETTKKIIYKNINNRLNQLHEKVLVKKSFIEDIKKLEKKLNLNSSNNNKKEYDDLYQIINNNPKIINKIYNKYQISNFFEKSIFCTLILESKTNKTDILKLLLGHLVMTHSYKACYNMIPFLKYDNYLNEYNIQCILFDDTKESDLKNSIKAIKYLQNLVISASNCKKKCDVIKYMQIDTLNKLKATKDLPDWEKSILVNGDDDSLEFGKQQNKDLNKYKKQKERSIKYFE